MLLLHLLQMITALDPLSSSFLPLVIVVVVIAVILRLRPTDRLLFVFPFCTGSRGSTDTHKKELVSNRISDDYLNYLSFVSSFFLSLSLSSLPSTQLAATRQSKIK